MVSETAANASGATGWRDLFAEGRLPQFALICLGVWLTAADSLVTATIMPSVGAALGGYAFFGWAVAGFLIGTVLACASAGRLSEIFGLRRATVFAAIFFAIGCVVSALAPDMSLFLLGRFMQGVGSGWVSGFAMVAIGVLFPNRHLARVFAAAAAIWGVATILGPMIGGFFAEAGNWRAVFWLFAVQGGVLALAAVRLLRGAGKGEADTGIPVRQLVCLAFGVAAVAAANVVEGPVIAAAFVLVGLALLPLVIRLDRNAAVRLLPAGAGDLTTVCGAGYAAMFALTAASMGLTVYGPALLQELRGLSPLWAGYAVGAEALAWTLAAFAISGVGKERDWIFIRLGGLAILAGAILLALFMPRGGLASVIFAAAVMGMGFGLSSSLMNRRVLAVLSARDMAIGSSALIATRQTGGAFGAAIAGVAANAAGFSSGLTPQSAEATAIWVFVVCIPLGIAGAWAAWAMTRSAGPAQAEQPA